VNVDPEQSQIIKKQGKITKINVTIPAYNVEEIDKCNPKRPVTKPEKVDLALKIGTKSMEKGVMLTALPSEKVALAAYLWEVQDGVPELSNKQEETFSFKLGGIKNIRLAAYTQDNRMVTKTTRINIKG
jgi:hypothetical protein